MPRPPLLSVVLPTRDRRHRLLRALQSVQAQTWENLEVVVVDDASTDGTPDLLAAQAAADARIRALRNDQPLGGAGARNRGLDAARGEIVAFLDDDDEWLPEKLERQVAFLDRDRSLAAVGCHHQLIVESRGAFAFRGPAHSDAATLLWDNFMGSTSFMLWRRDAFADEPRFDVGLASCQDWDVWLQCATQAPVAVVPEILCRHIAHGDARITGSAPARRDGRSALLSKYHDRMPDDCRSFNRARIRLLDERGGAGAAIARTAPPRVWWLLASSSVAGRVGWARRDPGRGSRWLWGQVTR